MVEFEKVSEFEWKVPVSGDMKVPGKIYSSDALVEGWDGKCLDQVSNVAKLPGVLGGSFAMPDMHMGYGFPIGGVAAFDLDEGVISPGGVGYDINCSVRLLKTNLREEDLVGKEKEIVHSLFRCVPSGVGRGGKIRLSHSLITRGKQSVKMHDELDEVLKGGAQWAVSKGYGLEEDWKFIESEGKIGNVDVSAVSDKAKGRGRSQLGTLGAGNHFLDVLIVDEVFDKRVAEVFGLEKGQVVILIHCGSRGLGHQVATDYIKKMSDAEDGGSKMEDGKDLAGFAKVGLACAPFKSELGQKYFGAMNAAANFAFANKQIITHYVRENMRHYFPEFRADVVYDICHNIAKVEKHVLREKMENGKWKMKEKDVLVMRKGATRAFGPGREEVPEKYREVGQPVLLPGSMGTASYVLVGTSEAIKKSFGSCAHGAGRAMSRSAAHDKISFEEARKDMEKRGVFVEFGKRNGMVEESPGSYKDVDEVVEVCDSVGLGKKVVRLRPKLVVIG